LPTGDLLDEAFFEGNIPLQTYLSNKKIEGTKHQNYLVKLKKILLRLKEKGVIINA